MSQCYYKCDDSLPRCYLLKCTGEVQYGAYLI